MRIIQTIPHNPCFTYIGLEVSTSTMFDVSLNVKNPVFWLPFKLPLCMLNPKVLASITLGSKGKFPYRELSIIFPANPVQ